MTITPLYAGILALWFFILSARVVQKRRKIWLGDGGDPDMLRRIRGHGNFAEYVPFILLMMAILEVSNFRGWWLHVIGIVLVVARVFHGISLSFTQKWILGRAVGSLLTFLLLLVTGVLCLLQGIRGFGV